MAVRYFLAQLKGGWNSWNTAEKFQPHFNQVQFK